MATCYLTSSSATNVALRSSSRISRESVPCQAAVPCCPFRKNQLASVRTSVRGLNRRERRFSVSASATSEDISQTYVPAAPFYKVEAIIRPWRLSFVAKALIKMGIRGVTVSDVRGFGAQGGSRERQAGSEFTDDSLVSKVKMEVVVVHEQVDEVVECIINEARTGEIGDGKIFVSPVSQIIRVRTGERGIEAERMAGGRMEILSSAPNSNGNA